MKSLSQNSKKAITDEINKKLGWRIRVLRKKKRLSQKDFATKCGLSASYIGELERGEKGISLNNLKKIAEALNINLSELIDDI